MIPQAEKKAVHPILIFKEGWGFFRGHFKTLAAIYFLTYFISRLLMSSVGVFFPEATNARLLVSLLALPLSFWGFIALIFCANMILRGETQGVAFCLKQSLRHFFPYLGGSFIIGGFSFLVFFVGIMLPIYVFYILRLGNPVLGLSIFGFFVLISVGLFVYFILRWSLYGIVCVTEDAGPVGALKRSFILARRYINPLIILYGLFFLLGIPKLIPVLVLSQAQKSVVPSNVLWVFLISSGIDLILAPLWACVAVVLYHKLKEAAEG